MHNYMHRLLSLTPRTVSLRWLQLLPFHKGTTLRRIGDDCLPRSCSPLVSAAVGRIHHIEDSIIRLNNNTAKFTEKLQLNHIGVFIKTDSLQMQTAAKLAMLSWKSIRKLLNGITYLTCHTSMYPAIHSFIPYLTYPIPLALYLAPQFTVCPLEGTFHFTQLLQCAFSHTHPYSQQPFHTFHDTSQQ